MTECEASKNAKKAKNAKELKNAKMQRKQSFGESKKCKICKKNAKGA